MTFEEYCFKKKIDADAFKASEPGKWQELKFIFDQVHPESFTTQKKFLINDLRRKYHLKESPKQEESKAADVKKPAVKIPGGKPSSIKIPPKPKKE